MGEPFGAANPALRSSFTSLSRANADGSLAFAFGDSDPNAMKLKLILSLIWLAGTFLLLSSVFYAANDYDRHMLAAVTGDPGGAPTLDRARALEVQKLKAKTIEEVDALKGEIGQEIVRYGNAMSGSVSRRKMIQRAWILWSVSAFVPLVFLWWSDLAVFWRRLQLRHVAEERSAEGARS